jgi:hypothetical protein
VGFEVQDDAKIECFAHAGKQNTKTLCETPYHRHSPIPKANSHRDTVPTPHIPHTYTQTQTYLATHAVSRYTDSC